MAALPQVGAFNLSGCRFDDSALAVLNCGLKFVPTPAARSVSGATNAIVDSFARNVRLRVQFQRDDEMIEVPRFYVPNPGFQPAAAPQAVEDFLIDVRNAVSRAYRVARSLPAARPQNLTGAQRAALAAVRNNQQIVIKPADKNLGLVILDRAVYDGMLLSVLQDPARFTVVASPDIAALRGQLQSLLTRWQNGIGSSMFKYMWALSEGVCPLPRPYAMPKIHKLPSVERRFLAQLTGRVIVPCHSWITTGASQYLADLLNGVCARRFPHVLPDSRTLIKQLDNVAVASNSILVTFDVEDMYPSIDSAAAILHCAAAAPGSARMLVEQLLQFVLSNTFCQRGGVVYQQTSGVTMGTACAPPVANIYMATAFEAAARQQSASWPRFYFRLIDDGFFVWEGSQAALAAFIALLGGLLPNIRLTFQQHSRRIQYLDVWIEKGVAAADGTVRLLLSTYQKPHNKYLYIPAQSHHRTRVFRGFIRAELLRYLVTNTCAADFERVRALFWQRLIDRGYTPGFLQPIFAAVTHGQRASLLAGGSRQQQRRRQAAPALVAVNDQHAHSRINLSRVVNDVYQQYRSDPNLQALFGARVVVSYRNPPSLGRLLVRAAD